MLALWVYGRKITCNNKAVLNRKGPLLLAANHPNSFLDAIILASMFKQPIYSLVRGDVYKHPFIARLLRSLNMMPVYRISEGAENLGENYSTFMKCREIFKKKGIVLIFSEGRCINEWKLRPLMKGTARLATSSWEEGIPLEVLPVGINYQSFTSFGKNIHVLFGNTLTSSQIELTNSHGNTLNDFNSKLQKELRPLVFETSKNNLSALRQQFEVKQPMIKKIVFTFPALIGAIVHAPLYFPAKWFSKRYASHNDHYDSLMVALLFISYPIYLIGISLLSFMLWQSGWAFVTLLVLPFCARACIQLKPQF